MGDMNRPPRTRKEPTMPKAAKKITLSREEQQDAELQAIGRRAFESIAEMVAKLDAVELDDDGQPTDEPDEEARDKAREEIQEDALSVQVRSGWYTPGDGDGSPEEFELLLGTGGPAVRIIGDLDHHGQPTSARLETQNWGTPWTEYRGWNGAHSAYQATLLAYCQCFYFGEGG